jgi:aminopeptidase N
VSFNITGTDNDAAIIVNVLQKGFYRVNYDLDNWNKISEALLTDPESIHRTNRAQILNDALSLARAGLLDYEAALNQTR